MREREASRGAKPETAISSFRRASTGGTVTTVVGRSTKPATGGVFSNVSSADGFNVRVMSREAFDRAVDEANKKLREVIAADRAKD